MSAGAELRSTSAVEVQYRFGGERVLVFSLDSNLRVESVKDEKGGAKIRREGDFGNADGEKAAAMLTRFRARKKKIQKKLYKYLYTMGKA